MNLLKTSILAATLATGAALVAPSTAEAANLDSCGNIHVEANAQCELVTGGGCEAMCEPVSFEAACAGRLAIECGGQCNASASVDCTVDCEASCQGRCEVDPPQFDCRAECVGDCEGACSGRCSSEDSECLASCRGTCGIECDGQCEATPPEADCNAKCEASCGGSCEAQANIDCQIDCQADGFVDCEAELRGGCEVECSQPEGALFCDGQYVDHGNNLEECLDALRAVLDIEVEGSASGQCSNGRCTGEAEGGISCAVDPESRSSAWALGWFGAITTSLLVLGRRRRRNR
jgi:hypothetical protein